MQFSTLTGAVCALSMLGVSNATWYLTFYANTGGHHLETHGNGASCYTISSSYKRYKTAQLYWKVGGDSDEKHATVYTGVGCTGNHWGVQTGTHTVSPAQKFLSYKISA